MLLCVVLVSECTASQSRLGGCSLLLLLQGTKNKQTDDDGEMMMMMMMINHSPSFMTGLRGSLSRLQLDYVDIVFANRNDVNSPMEGQL